MEQQAGKTTAIRRNICPRDWHLSGPWGPFVGPLKPLGPSDQYRSKRHKGALHWSPIMPEYAIHVFQSRVNIH